MQGQVAIVTGAGRGIGRATAVQLSSLGVHVLLVSRTVSELNEAKRACEANAEPGVRIGLFAADLSQPGAAVEVFREARRQLGSPSILINNAAMAPVRGIEKIDAELLDQVHALNVRAPMLLSKELFLECRQAKHGGAIVNLSSLGGLRGTEKFPGFAAYSASKFAVVGMTECLAVEGRELDIRVNCIAPGAVDTLMLRQAAPNLKTRTKPEDIAEIISFLCDSSRSGGVTGAVIDVNSNI